MFHLPIGILELIRPQATNTANTYLTSGRKLPIPPGVINNRGLNTFALSQWTQTDAGANLSEVKMINYGLYRTGCVIGPHL